MRWRRISVCPYFKDIQEPSNIFYMNVSKIFGIYGIWGFIDKVVRTNIGDICEFPHLLCLFESVSYYAYFSARGPHWLCVSASINMMIESYTNKDYNRRHFAFWNHMGQYCETIMLISLLFLVIISSFVYSLFSNPSWLAMLFTVLEKATWDFHW